MRHARFAPSSPAVSLLWTLPPLLCILLSFLPLSVSSSNDTLISSLLHEAAAYRFGLPASHQYDYDEFYRPTYSSAYAFSSSSSASFSTFAFSSFSSSSSPPSSSPSTSQHSYPHSLSRAMSLYQEAAALNSSVALLSLGEIYLFGEGAVAINITHAASFLHTAASLGNGRAHHLLAFLYTTSLLPPPSPHTPAAGMAMLHAYFAVLALDPLALSAFGFRHLHGLSVPRSCETAVRLYMRLAQRVVDEVEADPVNRLMEKVRLQDMDEGARSVVSNVLEEDRLYYYQSAAERGDSSASLALGHAYTFGFHGLTVDYVAALHYYRLAADSGDVAAQTRVAFMYLHGLGGEKREAAAFELLQRVVSSAMPTAASFALLGHMYEHGLSTSTSLINAASLYKRAAKHNSTDGLYHLGRFHFGGLGGLPQSYDKAEECWQRCALAGHTLCLHRMAEVQRLGLAGVASCDLAVELYKAVAERGSWVWGMEDAFRRWMRGDVEGALLVYMRLAYEGHEVAQSNAAYLLHLNYGYSAIKRSAVLPQSATPSASSLAAFLSVPSTVATPSSYHHRHSLAYLFFSHSALQSNPVSHRMIGDIQYYGLPPLSRPDYQTALAHYQHAAHAGNAHAAFNLGWLKEWVGAEWDEALYWYERSGGEKGEAVAVVWVAKVRLRLHRWIRQRGWMEWGGLAVWQWQWKGWDWYVEWLWMAVEQIENPVLMVVVAVVAVLVQQRRRVGPAPRQ